MGRLTAGHVRTVKQPGSYGDGRGGYGLTLLVRPRASGGVRKSWSQRIRIGGRTTNIGLGPYPVVGLAEARKKALANRRMIEQGIDPRRGRTPTFAEAADQVIEMNRKGWKRGASTETRWRSSFRNY
ncbi:MAG: Arm DNA-binding domain-containing protein, partial [bacterium]|nr:Arm DNA-binding domain-containing protein [bacterium]